MRIKMTEFLEKNTFVIVRWAGALLVAGVMYYVSAQEAHSQTDSNKTDIATTSDTIIKLAKIVSDEKIINDYLKKENAKVHDKQNKDIDHLKEVTNRTLILMERVAGKVGVSTRTE